jgi:hypothetical protein
MARTNRTQKRRLTIALNRETVQRLKGVAARQSTSVGELVARQIETLVSKDGEKGKDYERTKRHALALLDRGFNLGGKICVSRDELHER